MLDAAKPMANEPHEQSLGLVEGDRRRSLV